VFITLLNVAQVEDLFQGIIKGELQLDPVIFAKLNKLLKGASKAIANAKIQHSTHAELIAAKENQSAVASGRNRTTDTLKC
jgi:hypothetical protein